MQSLLKIVGHANIARSYVHCHGGVVLNGKLLTRGINNPDAYSAFQIFYNLEKNISNVMLQHVLR